MFQRLCIALITAWMAIVAQAVTIPWKSRTETATTQGGGYVVDKTGAQNPNTVLRLRFSLSALPTSGCLLVYGSYEGENGKKGGVHLYYDKNGHLTAEMEYNITGGTSVYQQINTPELNVGANEIVIAVQRPASTNTSSIFINGVECFTLVQGGQSGFDWSRIKFGAPFTETDVLKALEGAELSSISVEQANGTTIQDVREYCATLPEPTVLALLSLGMAGLALRRHVA